MSDPDFDDDLGPGIALDANGDPVRQGSLMVERQSYERVIDGLRIAAEACMHIAHYESDGGGFDRMVMLARNLDRCRRMCIRHAGLDDVGRSSPTERLYRPGMAYRESRQRLIDGIMNAAGGARQLATCHRMDLAWSRVAYELEQLERSLKRGTRMRTINPLLLPTGYVRH